MKAASDARDDRRELIKDLRQYLRFRSALHRELTWAKYRDMERALAEYNEVIFKGQSRVSAFNQYVISMRIVISHLDNCIGFMSDKMNVCETRHPGVSAFAAGAQAMAGQEELPPEHGPPAYAVRFYNSALEKRNFLSFRKTWLENKLYTARQKRQKILTKYQAMLQKKVLLTKGYIAAARAALVRYPGEIVARDRKTIEKKLIECRLKIKSITKNLRRKTDNK